MKLYLRKNKKAIEVDENGELKYPKVPYFTLLVVPEEKGGDWLEVASFWKSPKLLEDGTVAGYNGLVGKGAVIDVSKVVPYKKQVQNDSQAPQDELSDAEKEAIAESEYKAMGD